MSNSTMQDNRAIVRFRPSIVLWVFLIAVGVRFGALTQQFGRFTNVDAHDYVNIARSIVSGHGFAFETRDPNIVFRGYLLDHRENLPDYLPTAWRPPLYCYWLALWMTVGMPMGGIQLVQCFMGAMSVAGIAMLVRKAGYGSLAQWAAGLSLAFNPYSAYLCVSIGTEGLFEFLNVALLAAVAVTWRGTTRWSVVPGVLIGLMILCRPGAALIGVCFFLALVLRRGPNWLDHFAANALACGGVLSLWLARCAIVFGSFVPITTIGGLGMWLSWVHNHAVIVDNSRSKEMYFHGTEELNRELKGHDELEINRIFSRRAKEFLAGDIDAVRGVYIDHLKQFTRLGAQEHYGGSLGEFILSASKFYMAVFYLMGFIACMFSGAAWRIGGVFLLCTFIFHTFSFCYIRHRTTSIDATWALCIGLGVGAVASRRNTSPESPR